MHPTVLTTALSPRHIIFFGQIGSGKSSVINLLGAGDAPVSNDTRPCTKVSACYKTSLDGRKYCLWDTRGLGEGRNLFKAMLGWGSEKDLKKFLKERHSRREINLLVYCIQGSRATKAIVNNYVNFCAISRRLAAPVAIVVTGLEKEENMDNWWRRNAPALSQLKMVFDEHACITALPGLHQAESKEKLVNLISRDYTWEPTESGSYFGSSVPIPTRSAPPRHEGRMIWNLFKPKYKDNINNGSLHRQRNDSGPSTTISSARNSEYYSVPSTPTVIPPTPPSATVSIDVNTYPPIINNPSQSSSEDISSVRSSPYPMSSTSSLSSRTSQSSSFTEEIKGFLNDLSITNLTSTVKRRKGYATHNGGFGDIWECDLLSEGPPRKVAVKAIKTKPEEIEYHLKKLHRELRIWRGLNHRNVVPLLGVVSDFGHLPSMVSPWFSNGSLSIYLKAHHTLNASRRRRLLRDIAVGLCYLHSQDVIHGDLHSGNILIDDDGTACLTDFGLSFVDDFARTSYLKSSICGSMAFADPALVKRVSDSRDIIHPTKPCDVYSFGGLLLHVLSGRKPYDEIRSTSVLLTIMNGERPQIPDSVTRECQSVIQSCWDREEGKRPSADGLARMFDP